MPDRELLFLSAQDLRRALPMTEAVAAMQAAFRELSAGDVTCPARMHVAVPAPPGDALFMPCHSAGRGLLSLKTVTLFPENGRRGLPFIQALLLLLDGRTGLPLAVLEGGSLTALRTGAASGAATEVLARPDARRAAILGAGVQGRTQLAAICAVRALREARVFDPQAERAAAFAREMAAELDLSVSAVASPAAALHDADVVCTATTATSPVFADGDLAPGAHVNAVGAYKPSVREVPAATVHRARVVVDSRAAAREEAGDLLLARREGGGDGIDAELGEVLAGRKAGRGSPEEVTLFKSVGVAIQDLVAAQRAVENARRLGLGTTVRM